MAKRLSTTLVLALLCMFAFGADFERKIMRSYPSEHFVIHSNLDPRFMEFVKTNAEAFYSSLAGTYFKDGWTEPLTIYYCESSEDVKEAMSQRGHEVFGDCWYYAEEAGAVYACRHEGGEDVGWQPLFGGIAGHFCKHNLKHMPWWFQQELCRFFGERAVIVDGEVAFGLGDLESEKVIAGKNVRMSVNRLYSERAKSFYVSDSGLNLARVLVHWLYSKGELFSYLNNCQRTRTDEKGSEVWVLEKTVGLEAEDISRELQDFSRREKTCEGYLAKAEAAEGEGKESVLLEALNFDPGFARARLLLGSYYKDHGAYDLCIEHMKQIVGNGACVEYAEAAVVLGASYYSSKEYQQAVDTWIEARKHSKFDAYGYKTAFYIANSYYYMGDNERAGLWYDTYLKENWEPEVNAKLVAYAERFLTAIEEQRVDCNDCQ